MHLQVLDQACILGVARAAHLCFEMWAEVACSTGHSCRAVVCNSADTAIPVETLGHPLGFHLPVLPFDPADDAGQLVRGFNFNKGCTYSLDSELTCQPGQILLVNTAKLSLQNSSVLLLASFKPTTLTIHEDSPIKVLMADITRCKNRNGWKTAISKVLQNAPSP